MRPLPLHHRWALLTALALGLAMLWGMLR